MFQAIVINMKLNISELVGGRHHFVYIVLYAPMFDSEDPNVVMRSLNKATLYNASSKACSKFSQTSLHVVEFWTCT